MPRLLQSNACLGFEDPAGAGKLHHLTVLCYHLQHPSLYSPETLKSAKQFLGGIIENKMSAQELLEINRKTLASNKRTWKVKGTPENHGSYSFKIKWSMTASDIFSHGLSSYTELVQKWAESIYEDLKVSGNLI
jgi:hypothetical protein